MFFYIKKLITLIFIAIFLNNCSNPLNYFDDEEEEVLQGKRYDILTFEDKLEVDSESAQISVLLGLIEKNSSWNQLGRTPNNSSGNLFLRDNLQPLWDARVGEGDDGYSILFSNLVSEGGKVFSLDSEGIIFSVDLATGQKLWKKKVVPKEESINSNIDGGIALTNGILIVSTSYGEMIALRAEDGSIFWKVFLGIPAQGSPAIIENSIFQMTVNNSLIVIDLQNGNELWRYAGSYEPAILNGASSPAVDDNIVVFPSNSGELIAFNKNLGSIVWTTELSIIGSGSIDKDLNDIDSGPVIDNNLIFAGTVKGRFGALDYQTGLVIWDIPLKTTHNPVISGNSLFVLSEDDVLVNIVRDTGGVRWMKDLKKANEFEESSFFSSFKSDKTRCNGPILAANKLWISCLDGSIYSIDVNDGSIANIFKISSPIIFPPIVVEGVIMFYTKNARIYAYR